MLWRGSLKTVHPVERGTINKPPWRESMEFASLLLVSVGDLCICICSCWELACVGDGSKRSLECHKLVGLPRCAISWPRGPSSVPGQLPWLFRSCFYYWNGKKTMAFTLFKAFAITCMRCYTSLSLSLSMYVAVMCVVVQLSKWLKILEARKSLLSR